MKHQVYVAYYSNCTHNQALSFPLTHQYKLVDNSYKDFLFIFPSQHASNITYINIYNSLNHGLYLHTMFEFIVIYRGGGGVQLL